MADKYINKETIDIELRYTCPACPPIGISIDSLYLFGKDEKGFYYRTSDDKHHAELWFIKMLFTPTNKAWDEVDKLIK